MILSERLLDATTEMRDQATAYVARAADAARATADVAASRMAAARTPLEVLTEASLKLNALSHEHVARMLRLQAAMLKGTVAEGEKRLQRLARAESLRHALAAQTEDLNAIPRRVAQNARESWQIVAEAGRSVSELASATFAGLTQPATVAKPRKPARGKRAPVARKRAASRRGKAAKAA
jgi:phasin family protein